jgi:hypothetical protein
MRRRSRCSARVRRSSTGSSNRRDILRAEAPLGGDDEDDGLEDPADAVTPAPVEVNPLDRAREALRAARVARGLPPDEEPAPAPVKSEPLAKAEAALGRARAAREEAAQGGPKAVERMQRAREELEKLKARGMGGAKDSPADGEETTPPTAPAAKPRRL